MDVTPRSIALAGIGKIARDAHVPALNDSADWELAATISRNGGVDGVDGYEDIDGFLDARPDIDTVSLALPPGPRYEYAAKSDPGGTQRDAGKAAGLDPVGMRGAGGPCA